METPKRRDHLPVKQIAVAVAIDDLPTGTLVRGPAAEVNRQLGLPVRTHGRDSPQNVKCFRHPRGTTLSWNSRLRTNKINDLPNAVAPELSKMGLRSS